MRIQYVIRGTKADRETKIYARFKIPGGAQTRIWTGFYVNPKNWSISKERCINRDPFLKKINSSLDLISSELIKEIATTTELIDKRFCENVIADLFDRTEKHDTTTLVGLQLELIKEAPTKIVGQTMGLTEGTIQRYKTFLGVLRSYDEEIGYEARLTDMNKIWVEKFIVWCTYKQKYSSNYTGRCVSRLRQLAGEADKRGLKVNPYAIYMKSFKQKAEERIIHTLTNEEIDKIKYAGELPPFLSNARKWLLIAVCTGNRVGDLMKLTPDSFRELDGMLICDVKQQKTKEFVSIPIVDETVIDIIKADFPRPISEQKFNDYIKELAKRTGIDDEVEGNKRIDNAYQKIKGPKWMFLASHCARRTFATLAIERGIPHSRVMAITGHKNLDVFLKYVNKEKDRDWLALEFARYLKQMPGNND